MTLTDLIKDKRENIIVIHSSRREGMQVIPDSIDEVWKLLDIYAHENHKKHINNWGNVVYLNVGLMNDHQININWFWHIDLRDLKSDIRNKKLNELI